MQQEHKDQVRSTRCTSNPGYTGTNGPQGTHVPPGPNVISPDTPYQLEVTMAILILSSRNTVASCDPGDIVIRGTGDVFGMLGSESYFRKCYRVFVR